MDSFSRTTPSTAPLVPPKLPTPVPPAPMPMPTGTTQSVNLPTPTAPLRDEFRTQSATGKLTPQTAEKEVEAITKALGKVRTPDGAVRLAEQTQALATRVAAGEFGQVDKALAKDLERLNRATTRAGEAVTRLEDLQDKLGSGSPHDQAAVAAELLAHPLKFGADIRSLKAFEGSPLLTDQKKAIDAITQGATPQALARQLSADPDLSHYPPEMVSQLAKLRAVPDPKLQGALDQVGKALLDQSKAAREAGAEIQEKADAFGGGLFGQIGEQVAEAQLGEAPTDPLSAEAVKANPALGQLLAPMQASQDPAVKEALDSTVKGWAKDALQSSLKANETGSDDPKARAEKTITDFREQLVDLANQTGLGATLEATSQDAVKDVSVELLEDDDIDFEAINKNPAYGQLIAGLKADESLKGRVDEKVLGMADDMLEDHLDGKEGEDGLKEATEAFQADMQTLGETTGLGFDEAMSEKFSAENEGEFKEVLDRGRNLFQKAVDGLGGLVGKLGFVGEGLAWGFDKVGDLGNLYFDTIGKGLGAIGFEAGEKAFDKVGDFANNNYDMIGKFHEGVAKGITGMVSGALFVVSHPVQSGKGIVAAVKDPGKLTEALLADAKGGHSGGDAVAHGAGYVVANLLPALLSGGASTAGTLGNTAAKAGKLASFTSKATHGLLGSKLATKLDDVAKQIDGKYLNPADELADPKAFARNNAALGLRLKNALVAGESGNVVGALKALYGANGKLPDSIPKPVRQVLEAYDRVSPNSAVTKQLKRKLSDTQINQLRTALKLNQSLQAAVAQENFQAFVEQQKKQLS